MYLAFRTSPNTRCLNGHAAGHLPRGLLQTCGSSCDQHGVVRLEDVVHAAPTGFTSEELGFACRKGSAWGETW